MAYSHEPKSEHVHHLVSSKYIESLMSVGRVVLRRVFRAICFKSLENWTRANAAATMCDTGTLSVPVDQVRVKTNVVLCCRIRRGCVACENNHSIYIQGVYQLCWPIKRSTSSLVCTDGRTHIYMYMCCGVLTTPSFVPCPRSPFIDFLGDFLPYTVLSQQLYSSSEIADMCCGRTLVCIQPVLIVTRIRQRSTLFKSLPQKIRES